MASSKIRNVRVIRHIHKSLRSESSAPYERHVVILKTSHSVGTSRCDLEDLTF